MERRAAGGSEKDAMEDPEDLVGDSDDPAEDDLVIDGLGTGPPMSARNAVSTPKTFIME